MEKTVLTPISFIKTQEIRQKYECGVCFQVCVKPVRCKGQCKRIYCMKCVSEVRQTLDMCPNRCSSPFLVQQIPDITLDFFCPYSPTECSLSIGSVKEFEIHHKVCPFVPPEQVHRQKLKKQYKCLNGHQLLFFIGSYQEMTQSQCYQCKQEKLCRSVCRICDHLYCVSCRVPPCSKKDCPMGHKYNYQRIANLNYICDFCGISTSVSHEGVYDDPCCNFGICQGCYQELPQQFDASKPRQLIANITTQCLCGENLTEIKSIHQLHKCAICLRQRQCPKQCQKCLKFFCLKCKMMDLQNDRTCSRHDHTLLLFNLNNFPATQKIQHEYGCMRCQKVHDEYFVDRHCWVRLCRDCVNYGMKVTKDKKRCIVLKCDKNHVLTYIDGPSDIIDYCSACKKQKIIKLQCFFCQQQFEGMVRNKCYCFQCRPIKLETCYYQHKLKWAQFNGSRNCQFCTKQSSQFHYCKKCFFYVCKECKEINQKKSQLEIEVEQQQSISSEENMQVKLIKQDHSQMEEQIAAMKIQ